MNQDAQNLARELTPQVQRNCDLSNAHGAGRFSLCGLLLRLRNLYKWQRGMAPWQEEESSVMLDWVSRQEEHWDSLLEHGFAPIKLDGRSHDPFEVEAINQALEPAGLIYGAGLAGGLLPVFFLAELNGVSREMGLTIYRLGRELCHDIYLLPGLRQDSRIYLRQGPMPFLLWDRVADPTPSLLPFSRFALAGYGLDYQEVIDHPNWEAFQPVLDGEMLGVRDHELGEAIDGPLAGELLVRVIEEHPASDLEHFVRGVKDLLADTGPHGRLAGIIQSRRQGALGFYPVWLAGFPRLLFPEIDPAVKEFMTTGDWDRVDQARQAGWDRAQEAVSRLSLLTRECSGERLLERARREVIEDLTAGCQVPDEADEE